ncbi:hypothetical protein SeMB42_g01359 [Synchytrium endobioticum]|uniref:MPN domain-containing protein n=1 Tax=Synchytrium endobioticum TaxID=286115 RepID=A0A507DNT6_9FUNG|nr:hypothetical protein SeLEV6574_g01373 [Synchytrium endobioticum]TPX52528.1 hypothetical protein SeMB42_g01359 [Synchytrium endobioticum]
MPLTEVHLPSQVYLLFTSFALCTEREECVALLLGTYTPEPCIAHISTLMLPSLRHEKKRDRVEISDADMTRAIAEADTAHLQVIGWIHSHPHITVLPSHVDLRTQATHQQMDDRWFGVIVSCFSGDTNAAQRIQINCFQATPNAARLEIPIIVTPGFGKPLDGDVLSKLVGSIPELFFNEETTSFETSLGVDAAGAHVDRMTLRYNSNLYIQMLTNLIDKVCGPLLGTMQLRHERNLKEIQAITRCVVDQK